MSRQFCAAREPFSFYNDQALTEKITDREGRLVKLLKTIS
jgi:hypothetical protein